MNIDGEQFFVEPLNQIIAQYELIPDKTDNVAWRLILN